MVIWASPSKLTYEAENSSNKPDQLNKTRNAHELEKPCTFNQEMARAKMDAENLVGARCRRTPCPSSP